MAIDSVSWIMCSVQCAILRGLSLAKYIVEEWLLYYLSCSRIFLLMLSQTSTLSRKFARLRKRYLSCGRDLFLLYLDRLYIHTNTKLRSEYKWQPSNAASGYVLDEAYEVYNKNLKFLTKLFSVPYDYMKTKLKKPPDRIIFAVYVPIWITVFYVLYNIIGVMKIWYLVTCRTWKWMHETWVTSYNAVSAFTRSTGITTMHERVRKRRKRDKVKRTKRKRSLIKLKLMMLATIFATTKNPSSLTK